MPTVLAEFGAACSRRRGGRRRGHAGAGGAGRPSPPIAGDDRHGTAAARAGAPDGSNSRDLRNHIRWLERRVSDVDDEIGTAIGRARSGGCRTTCCAACPGSGRSPRARSRRAAGARAAGSRAIAALVGVAPFNCDSGQHRGQRHIWGGRASVRAVSTWRPSSPPATTRSSRVFYRRLRAAGKPAKLALVATMRKLLTMLNAMMKHQAPWNPKVASTPASPSRPARAVAVLA